MNAESAVPVEAILDIPSWMWGGNPLAFLAEAQLRGSELGRGTGKWRVRTNESWQKSRPSLVTVAHIAGPSTPRPRFTHLERMTSSDTAIPTEAMVEEVNRLSARAEQTKSPVDALTHFQLRTMVAPSIQLAEIIRNIYQNLLLVGMASNPDDKVFANAGVHVIQRSPALLHRLKMPSVWLRILFDEALVRGDLSQVNAAAAAGETAFASSQGLYEGIYTLDTYIAPLLGALSPAVWSFSAARMLGTVIYTLGQPLAGAQGIAAELLQVLPSQGAMESLSIPTLSAMASSDSVTWWVDRLNDLFSILSDPAVFTDQAGNYVPAKQLQSLLTVEQLFRRVSSIQLSHRDTNARRTLLFTVLDTLERLTGRDILTLCSLPLAEKTLESLESRIPAAVAEVILPGADRAVHALRKLQDGFFIRRHAGASDVEWTDPQLGPIKLTPAEAAAQYIKVLRDATHGHGSKKQSQIARTNALLIHHDGRVPHDLGLIGYLYLVDVISRPSDLRMSLYGRGRIL